MDLDKVGVRGHMSDQVLRLAGLALTSGCHGVVASAWKPPSCARNWENIF